jgi:hypothetical protein
VIVVTQGCLLCLEGLECCGIDVIADTCGEISVADIEGLGGAVMQVRYGGGFSERILISLGILLYLDHSCKLGEVERMPCDKIPDGL